MKNIKFFIKDNYYISKELFDDDIPRKCLEISFNGNRGHFQLNNGLIAKFLVSDQFKKPNKKELKRLIGVK